jgi:hypothetical protein
VIVSLLLLAVLWLAAWICRAAASGRITRNHVIGIRLPSTLASDEAWRVGHAGAYRPALLAATIASVPVLAGVVAALLTPPNSALVPLFITLGVVTLVGGIVWSTVAASRAARKVSRS